MVVLTGNKFVDWIIAASAVTLALVTLFKYGLKAGHVIASIDKLVGAIIGGPGKTSIFDRLDDQEVKLEILSKKPAMNGGFDKLVLDVNEIKAKQIEGHRASDKAATLAKAAADKAEEAVVRVEAGFNERKNMHEENKRSFQTMNRRLNSIDTKIKEGEEREKAYIAILAEAEIDLTPGLKPHIHEVSEGLPIITPPNREQD
jgi:hypothetical protein